MNIVICLAPMDEERLQSKGKEKGQLIIPEEECTMKKRRKLLHHYLCSNSSQQPSISSKYSCCFPYRSKQIRMSRHCLVQMNALTRITCIAQDMTFVSVHIFICVSILQTIQIIRTRCAYIVINPSIVKKILLH